MKITKILLLLLMTLLLTSCGSSGPTITHITVKSDSSGILLDTDKRSTIRVIEKIFYDKVEKPDAGPDFKYLIDLTIDEKTVRWQYSIDGYIRNYEVYHSKMYQVKDVAKFNRTAKIL